MKVVDIKFNAKMLSISAENTVYVLKSLAQEKVLNRSEPIENFYIISWFMLSNASMFVILKSN